MEKVAIKYLDSEKEHGLVATVDIEEDQIIFREDPIICAQYLYNRDFFPACSHCMKSLETPARMLQRLAGLDSEPALPPIDSELESCSDQDNTLRCHSCQREAYCSEKCRREAFESYHSILCTLNADDSHPLIRLEAFWKSFHFPPETATITLITRMIATIICQLNNGVSAEEAMESFSDFKCQYRNADIGNYESSLNILH